MFVYRRLATVRRAVFWIATALYVLTFPFIILDVTGIKVRLAQSERFVQTGAIEVTTRPDGCQLTVDGEPAKSLTPAVVEGLRPGSHEIVIQSPAGTVWRGSVEVASGEVTSVRGLPAGLPAITRVSVPWTLLKTARRSLVSSSVLLAGMEEPRLAVLDLAAARITPLRGGPVRGAVAQVTPLVSDAEFLVEVEVGSGTVAMLLDQSALGGWSSTELPFGLPAGVLVLAGSWRERAVMFLDGQQVVQRGAAGDRALLVTAAPVVAAGVTPAGVLLLDRDGTLYHQGRFLAPRIAATYRLGALANAGAGPVGRIVAQKGAVLVVQAGSSVFLLTRSRSVEVPGVDGAVFDELRERIIVWSANRVGRLDNPWIETEAPPAGARAREPELSWILQVDGPVERVVPIREGDVVMIVTERAVLAGVLGERTLLETIGVAAVAPGGVRPVVDPAGVVLTAPEAGQVHVLRLWPAASLPGEQR